MRLTFYEINVLSLTLMKVHFLGEHAKRMTYSGQQICFIAHKCNLRPESKLILPAVKKAIVKWSIIFRTSIPCKRLVEVISDRHEYQSAGIFEQQTSILPFPTFPRVAPQWCWRSSCPLRRTRPALWRWTNIRWSEFSLLNKFTKRFLTSRWLSNIYKQRNN